MGNLYHVFGNHEAGELVKVIEYTGSTLVLSFGMPIQDIDTTIRQIAPHTNSYGELARLRLPVSDGDNVPDDAFAFEGTE